RVGSLPVPQQDPGRKRPGSGRADESWSASETEERKPLQGGPVGLALLHRPHEAGGDHAAQGCFRDQVDADWRRRLELAPGSVEQFLQFGGAEMAELLLVHSGRASKSRSMPEPRRAITLCNFCKMFGWLAVPMHPLWL